MKLAISVPSGFHIRELLLPLKPLIEQDSTIEKVTVITPAAPHHQEIFPDYSSKFYFTENQKISNVNLVITNTSGLDSNDPPVLEAAKKNNIKTLTFISSWDNVWKMKRLQNKGKPIFIADTLIVWNQIMRDHLLKIFPKINPESIHVIGAPRLDYFQHQDKIPSSNQLRDYLNIPQDGKLIHFATTELYSLDYIVETVVNAKKAGQIKDKLHFYASVHPGGDMNKHRPYAEKYGVTVRYSFGRQESVPHPNFKYNPTLDDIYMLVALFKHTDILINHSSSVALESFLGLTPVINVKYGKPFDWLNWYRSAVYKDFNEHYIDIINDGATKVVKNKNHLISAINSYLQNPRQNSEAEQKTLEKMITTTDGTASQHFFDLIKNIA